MKAIVTGGAGFIGSHLVKTLIANNHTVLNIDKLTYAGKKENLAEVENHTEYQFLQEDIVNQTVISNAIEKFKPDVVYHLAAESHVDRSIDDPFAFVRTNVEGTYSLLFSLLMLQDKNLINLKKFIHVSTDEVFGSLDVSGKFNEKSPYHPNSPYSASKASSDMLAKSFYYTYQLPIIVTNCSNNYGPNQFPEKLMPLVILNALDQKPLPIYGKGTQVRDWIYVGDHVNALMTIADKGLLGESYCIGGDCEKQNIEVVHTICNTLDEMKPINNQKKYNTLIEYVTDRPGHDQRYAIDNQKITNNLGWKPETNFSEGIKKTIDWYLNNTNWINSINKQQATQRRGLQKAV